MKILNLFCLVMLVFATIIVKAQAEPSDADIIKMQQVNGSAATTNAIYPQIVAQLKTI